MSCIYYWCPTPQCLPRTLLADSRGHGLSGTHPPLSISSGWGHSCVASDGRSRYSSGSLWSHRLGSQGPGQWLSTAPLEGNTVCGSGSTKQQDWDSEARKQHIVSVSVWLASLGSVSCLVPFFFLSMSWTSTRVVLCLAGSLVYPNILANEWLIWMNRIFFQGK